MTEAKRNKRVKPDPELVKLADALLANYQKPEELMGSASQLFFIKWNVMLHPFSCVGCLARAKIGTRRCAVIIY